MANYKLEIISNYNKFPCGALDWGDVGDIAIVEVGEPENGMIPAYGYLYHSGVTVGVEMLWIPGDYHDEYWVHGKEINKDNFIQYYKDAVLRNKPFPFDLEYIAPTDNATVYVSNLDIEVGAIFDFIEKYGDDDSTFHDICEFLNEELSKWKK